jgi:hypothetical protein
MIEGGAEWQREGQEGRMEDRMEKVENGGLNAHAVWGRW